MLWLCILLILPCYSTGPIPRDDEVKEACSDVEVTTTNDDISKLIVDAVVLEKYHEAHPRYIYVVNNNKVIESSKEVVNVSKDGKTTTFLYRLWFQVKPLECSSQNCDAAHLGKCYSLKCVKGEKLAAHTPKKHTSHKQPSKKQPSKKQAHDFAYGEENHEYDVFSAANDLTNDANDNEEDEGEYDNPRNPWDDATEIHNIEDVKPNDANAQKKEVGPATTLPPELLEDVCMHVTLVLSPKGKKYEAEIEKAAKKDQCLALKKCPKKPTTVPTTAATKAKTVKKADDYGVYYDSHPVYESAEELTEDVSDDENSENDISVGYQHTYYYYQ